MGKCPRCRNARSCRVRRGKRKCSGGAEASVQQAVGTGVPVGQAHLGCCGLQAGLGSLGVRKPGSEGNIVQTIETMMDNYHPTAN